MSGPYALCTKIVQAAAMLGANHRVGQRSDRGAAPVARPSGRWLLLGLVVIGSAPVMAESERLRTEARGWLRLESAQRSERDRIEPLSLEETRALEVIERGQRLRLRALEQANRRAADRAERSARLTPMSNLGVGTLPARDAAADIRRRAERYRQRLNDQQLGLPFGR